jgi:hypothetical protein
MKRELENLLGWVVVLSGLVFIGVSCSTTTPPATPSLTTNIVSVALPTPPGAPTQTVQKTVVSRMVNGVSTPLAQAPTNAPIRKLSLAWDAVPGSDHYNLYVSRGNQFWGKIINVGTNTTVTLTNFPSPLEFYVTAVASNGLESIASNEAYYGVPTNGSAMSGQFYFIASPTNTYVVSNAPLVTGPWSRVIVITNESGLRSVPLPATSGRISLGVQR